MKRTAAHWHRMAQWAEHKADEAAESDAPWAMRNVRIYQNYMSQWLGEALRAEREESK